MSVNYLQDIRALRPNYPYNCWYVAAFGEQVTTNLYAKRLLGIRVVLYRTADGTLVALEDRCAHRPHPLSDGIRDGDLVRCKYHGLAYDPTGLLVDVPSQDSPPQGVYVRTFPVTEQDGFIWIWLGDPGAASLRTPPRVPWIGDGQGWASTHETMDVGANYLLLHEHYLDLTNVFTLHPEVVPPDIDVLPPLDEVEISERSVSYFRRTSPSRLAAWEAEVSGLSADTTAVRRDEAMFVSPALHVQRYAIEPDDGQARQLVRVQAFTPEAPGSTHVFLQMSRDFAMNDAGVTEFLAAMFHDWIVRDAEMLENVQQRVDEEVVPRRNVNIKADRAAVRARRIALDMVAEESGSSTFV